MAISHGTDADDDEVVVPADGTSRADREDGPLLPAAGGGGGGPGKFDQAGGRTVSAEDTARRRRASRRVTAVRKGKLVQI